MSRALMERFGLGGYNVDGAYLRDGTKLKNIRIYKQRSDEMFDLIDPKTNIVYEKVILTGFSVDGNILDFNKGNDLILNDIDKNQFFVRAYSDDPDYPIKGFTYKFLYNKIVLSSKYVLYNMYTPYFPIYHGSIDNVIMQPIHVDDTSVLGKLFDSGGVIDSTGMVVTLTTPDDKVFSTDDVFDGKFIIEPVQLLVPGITTIVITSDYYDTKTLSIQILPATTDSDYVTSIYVSKFIQDGDIYTATIPSSVHGRGTDIIVELQEQGNIIQGDISVLNGDITISKYDDTPTYVIIIGETTHTIPYNNQFDSTSWTKFGDEYRYTISSTKHLRENISYSVYDMMGDIVECGVLISEDESITLSTYKSFSGNIVIA